MPLVDINNLTLRFPVYGADQRSLKRVVTNAVGGPLGRRSSAGVPVVTALQDVSLRLEAGDRIGLVGHNGAGKTTLLRTIAGAYQPDEGSVRVEGKVASLLDLWSGMDPFATGIDNIRLKGLMLGMSKKEMNSKVEAIAEFTELGPFLGMPIRTYSAGMVARLSFAVVTSVDADILIMDEWLGVGDANFRDKAQDRMMAMVENATIFAFASHDVGMLKILCNKFMGLSGGRSTGLMTLEELEEYMLPTAA